MATGAAMALVFLVARAEPVPHSNNGWSEFRKQSAAAAAAP